MNYESLILDIDGTLWDSRALVAEGYNVHLRKVGLEHMFVKPEPLKALFGKVLEDLADGLFPDLPEDIRYETMAKCMEAENEYLHANECKIGYPNVKETIAELSKKHRLFIVSNSQCGYPDLCVEKLGLTPYITGHLCYGDTGVSKGQTIRILMDKYNIESAVYIGDIQGDYEASQEAGIPFIWCSYGFGDCKEYVAKIDAFEDLLKL